MIDSAISRMDLRLCWLSLKRAVRICLVDLEIALQDAFGTVDYLSGFELIGERGLFALQEQALAFLLVQLSN